MADKKNFNIKGFTSLFLFLAIVVEFVSALILYVAPPGRVAHWTNWKFILLSKEGWQAVHTVFGYFMIVALILHLYYNWRVFTRYIKKKAASTFNLKKEIASAVILTLALWVTSVYSIPPISYIMTLGEYATESWEKKKDAAPISHAELLTLEQLAKTVNMPLDKALEKLKSAGFSVSDTKKTMEVLAKENSKSPNDLYQVIIKDEKVKVTTSDMEGSGYGRKSFSDIAKDKNVQVEDIIKAFKAKGIETTAKETLRDLNRKTGKSLPELMKILKSVTGE